MDWEQRQRAPSRFEADQEEQERELIESYPLRFEEWCRDHGLDPEQVGSVLEYEAWFSEEQHWD